jgi:tetratricopeptide (TPR) repeat protein
VGANYILKRPTDKVPATSANAIGQNPSTPKTQDRISLFGNALNRETFVERPASFRRDFNEWRDLATTTRWPHELASAKFGRRKHEREIDLVSAANVARRLQKYLYQWAGALPCTLLNSGVPRRPNLFKINRIQGKRFLPARGAMMIGARLVAFGFLTLSTLPLAAFGQTHADKSDLPPAENSAPTISVRELTIPDKARDAYNKGIQRFARKDWAGSVGEFQRAIAAYHDFYEAYYKIGLANLELRLGGDAETAFRKSIELSEGRFAPALFGLGLTLGNDKRFDDALAFIRAGLSLDPTSARGNFTLAWVLYTADRVSEAEKSALQAVLYNPDFAVAHLLLAQIHRRQNNAAATVEDLNAYLRLEPDSPRSAGVKAVRDAAARALDRKQENVQTVAVGGRQ